MGQRHFRVWSGDCAGSIVAELVLQQAYTAASLCRAVVVVGGSCRQGGGGGPRFSGVSRRPPVIGFIISSNLTACLSDRDRSGHSSTVASDRSGRNTDTLFHFGTVRDYVGQFVAVASDRSGHNTDTLFHSGTLSDSSGHISNGWDTS